MANLTKWFFPVLDTLKRSVRGYRTLLQPSYVGLFVTVTLDE